LFIIHCQKKIYQLKGVKSKKHVLFELIPISLHKIYLFIKHSLNVKIQYLISVYSHLPLRQMAIWGAFIRVLERYICLFTGV